MVEKVFKILAKDKKTDARVGKIMTKKGEIETPFFMPVATKASVKHISSLDLKEMGAEAIISNTFVLHIKPGEKLVKKIGGIAKFMNYFAVNVTDSGGFQMYSKACYLGSNDKGVFFRDPMAGDKLFITPEKDMEIQLDLDSDIAMCLDSMPLLENTKEEIAEAVRKTTRWAGRCKKHHDKMQKGKPFGKRQLLFGICQGGIHDDLREKSCKELVKMNFDGYSIGGLALGEPKEDEYRMIEIAKKIIPKEKPVYLMGAGHPIEILEAISRGVDMFDSRFPTQNARRGTLFTSKGRIRIMNKKYELDKRPIDEKCDCFVCKNYSRAYLRYQLMQEEGVGFRLASFHNLYYLVNLAKSARVAIKKGKYLEFMNKIKKEYDRADKQALENFKNNNSGKVFKKRI